MSRDTATELANPFIDARKAPRRDWRGFSLIELLVVVGIITVLVSLILPSVQSSREAARRLQCKNNMKQIGLALHNYHATHSLFPFASSCSFPAATRFTHVKRTWTELVLPFLDQSAVYQNVDFSVSVDVSPNRELFEQRVFPVFALSLCLVSLFLRDSALQVRLDRLPSADASADQSRHDYHRSCDHD